MMAKAKRKPYKYCIVPMCESTTVKTPSKRFFCLPMGLNRRKKWCNVMKRSLIGLKSKKYVCEDHFDVENDTENLIKCRLVGGTLRLKPDVCPHKFDCQNIVKANNEKERYEKIRRIEFCGNITKQEVPSSTVDNIESNETGDPIPEDINYSKSLLDKRANKKRVQINNKKSQKTKAKRVQTAKNINNATDKILDDNTNKKTVEISIKTPQKKNKKRVQINNKRNNATDENTNKKRVRINNKTSQEKKTKRVQTIRKRNNAKKTAEKCTEIVQEISPPNSPSILSISPGISPTDIPFSQTNSSNSLLYTITPQFCSETITKITNNVTFYTGLPEDMFFITKLLSESVASPTSDILMTLKKIRLNDSYERLAIDFNVCIDSVSLIFNKTCPLIADRMKQFIYLPSLNEIRRRLPISFRKTYSDTVCVLDSLDISIEKPAKAIQQALTWSELEHCNTMKYLISITPDGLISFISEGYVGSASETHIFEDCGFLQHLPRKCAVMAKRGFKNISQLLEKNECYNISSNLIDDKVRSNPEDVALRFNVDRTLGRLRDFSMVAPHACVDAKVIHLLNSIVVISCGMVNAQSI